MNSERFIGISDAFSAFVYGYPSSCPRAHCTPNKSMTTLRYTRRHRPVYIQAMPVGTYRLQSPGFPKIVHSFQKESHGKAKPTRNIYFLEFGFSWACTNSWNWSRSSYVFFPMDIIRLLKGKEKVNTLMRLRIHFDCSVKSTRWKICFCWSILVIRLTSNN